MSKIAMVMSSDRKDLTCEIARNSTNDELVKFVKDMDGFVQDWEFTKGLYDYFTKEMKKLAAER